jgi:hypothetical protein
MSNRLNSPVRGRPGLPPELATSGWTTLDYMWAAGLAWSLAATAPMLMVTPFWVSSLMSPPD